ncbi:hypothetical protein DB42_EV00080 [Neochlamydia sp. EPS4]|uniref:exodeoxyribonuclease V subunit gamma n=1 Tax=Neochlamydia sp. EPS4 TaxID=1478175 RepID=UPI000583912B|nr:exodeoxyribonuclease V subunit gamma [Neochlamydia sp. EPS4]KIC75618.1 hypothetical protein DB42_EV00080 [Neochlamydia sp. EPS4]
MIKTFYSNRIEILYDHLKKGLFGSSSPFARRLIIVPTLAIKSWLILQLAKDPELEIAAGLEIIYLEEALKKLPDFFSPQKNSFYYPNELELTLAIEAHIYKMALTWNTLSPAQQRNWSPLFDYLKVNVSSDPSLLFSKRSAKRLALLAETVAQLFRDYGKYGKAMVDEWNSDEQGWQQALWRSLFSSPDNNWSCFYNEPILANDFFIEFQVHLFSISFMANSDYLLFEKIAEQYSVNYYLLSPCSIFWSDILSEKEAKKLQQFWKKQKVLSSEQQELESYLRDKNVLLANWGKLGRKMSELLEQKDQETYAQYALPHCLQKKEIYSEHLDDTLIWEAAKHAPCLLDYIQADLLFMRNPDSAEKILISDDTSIQLHCAPTRQREIQILYNNLLELIKKEGDIEASDIIVMAPDITVYAPYIRQIFGTQNPQLDYQLLDMHALAEDSLTKQFWHLLNLPSGRWDAEDILYLFNFSTFQRKHQISAEEVLQIRTWLEDVGIHWGGDALHRNELLHQRHCQNMVDDTLKGTWEGGFASLLLGLAMDQLPKDSTALIRPNHVETSQAILLGKWIALMRALKKDLKSLVDGTKKSYQEWILELQRLTYTYLADKDAEEEENQDLFNQLDAFTKAACWLPNHKVCFDALKKHLETYLNHRHFTFQENHLQTVKFCSMLPMRSLPAKVIALVGMNESVFPRNENSSSLNLMKENKSCDYCPTRNDYDRYLFLEALLSARNYFILSYTHYTGNEGKDQASSLVVTELLHYIDQAFVHEKGKVSSTLTYAHPYRSFDYQYFSSEKRLPNYSYYDYQLASSYYLADKKGRHQFLHDFTPQVKVELNFPEIVLEIRHLKNALQNPIKSFLNKNLGMFLREEDHGLQTEEFFVINHLQMLDFKKASLKNSVNEAIIHAERQGKFPLGLFKQVALSYIHSTIAKYHETLSKLNVDVSKIFEITLHERYHFPVQDEKGWKLPPLEIYYKDRVRIKIVGSLSEVSEQGLIANISGNKNDILKPWGEFVILSCLIDHYSLPLEKQLLCSKSGKIKKAYSQQAFSELEHILEYYFESLHNVSPLTQEWLYDLVFHDQQVVQASMHQSLNDSFNPIYNKYLQWVCRPQSLNAANMIENWQTKARSLFSKPYQEWISQEE